MLKTKISLVAFSMALFSVLNAADYRFASSDPADAPAFKLQQDLLAKIAKETNNEVNIKLLPAGSLVEHDKTLEAVGQGALDGHITATEYFYKVDPALGLLANPVGAWSDPRQMLDFMNADGAELLREIYKPLGVYFIGPSTPGLEAFVSAVPLDGVDGLKDLKLRAPAGLIFDTFKAAGAKPFNIPGGDVPKALQDGVIQAADSTVFYGNTALNKIAKHPVYPGFHSMALVEISMNAKKWDALSDKNKEIINNAVKDYANNLVTIVDQKDAAAVEAAKKEGVTIHNWSAEERAKFRNIAQAEWKKFAEKSPNAKKVYEKLTTYLKSKDLM